MRRRAAALAASVLVLCGCGVTTQDQPEPLEITATPSASRPTDVDSGSVEAQVYFLRGTRLEAATRWVAAGDLDNELGALVTGPGRGEVLSGLRTAIAPQSDLTITAVADGTAQVDLPRELTEVTGGNQLLAFAQLVWTLTEVRGVRSVEFVSGGAPVEVPTDSGLAAGAVDRDDYATVGPVATTPPSNRGSSD